MTAPKKRAAPPPPRKRARSSTPPPGVRSPDEVAAEAAVNKQARTRLTSMRADALAKQMQADERAAERRERLPDFRKVDTAAWMRHKPNRRVVVGSESTGVVMRPGHMARLLSDYKAGKTTDGLDWLRSSLTGEPWLQHFPTVPIPDDLVVVHIDPELGDDDGRDYTAAAFAGCDEGVVNRLRRIDLHEADGFDWASSIDRAWLADQCEGAGRIFLDSVLQILPGTAVDDDAVKTFMRQFEQLKKDCGATEVMFSMHKNRSGAERSFGSVMWDAHAQVLLAKFAEPDGRFYMRGDRGRAGTGFAEGGVVLDDDGRPVFLPGRTRASSSRDKHVELLTEYVRDVLPTLPWDTEPILTGDVVRAIDGWDDKSPTRHVFDEVEGCGLLHRAKGPGNAKHVHPGTATACPACDEPVKIRARKRPNGAVKRS